MRKWLLGIFILLVLLSTVAWASKDGIPAAQREMRAAWVATVANIDWPSKPGISVEEQKNEAIKILDRVKELNMNAVVLQVRPQGDALYKSDLEPWSYYLTGQQGKAPEPFYDPLEFWVKEAHARGLELHAWFNPYRAGHPAMKSEISDKSIIKTKPNCVRKLAEEGYYWMDPAMKEVQDFSYAVVLDVVKRYDIDGVHFDDYFYPYAEYNKGKDFPDDDIYQKYKKNGGKLERGDWRRDVVNKFVKRVYLGIKKVKPFVKFGISPFGTYRPNCPEGYGSSFDQYATLYADAKLWLNKGWVDYLSPQLYWAISRVPVSYPVILGWWVSENKKARNIWPGLNVSGEKEHKEGPSETVNQVMVTRGLVPKGPGNLMFSMKRLMKNDTTFIKGIVDGPYKVQALVPASPWLGKKAPSMPAIKTELKDSSLTVNWQFKGKKEPFHYVLYIKKNDKWSWQIFPASTMQTVVNIGGKVTEIAVSAVDRLGNESKKAVYKIEEQK